MITRRGLLAGGPAAALQRSVTRKGARTHMPYLPCAGSPVSLPSAADTTGLNPGNWTTAFTTNVLGTMPAIWEWYRGVVGAQQRGQTITPAPCDIRVNQLKPVTFTFPVGGSVFSPPQPPIFRQGDELWFFWQLAATVTPAPYVTLFLRYDASLPANRGYGG